MGSLWKSAEAHARMQVWHTRFLEAIGRPLESRTVETRFGVTNITVGGPVDGPPVLLLHGALSTSAAVLHEVPALLDQYRVYSVDIVGQSAMSADRRLPVHDDSAGTWLSDVMDALRLDRAAVIGVSWGGFVAQRLAAVRPERVAALVLIVPAGMVAGPWWRGVREMGWPLTRYLLRPSARNRDALLAGLLSTPDDPLWGPFLADAFLAADMRGMRVPKRSKVGEFAGLQAPVHIVAAEHDVSFPGDSVVRRSRELFPSLGQVDMLAGARHSPPTTPEFRATLGARLVSFVSQT